MQLEAWIDVGGTFTDCLVRTEQGSILRHKTLSSSRVPLSIKTHNLTNCVAQELADDVRNFWVGAKLVGLAESGEAIWGIPIVESLSGGQLCLEACVDWHKASRFEIWAPVEAPVLAVHRAMQLPLDAKLPPIEVRLGTTRGTNALLTRTGANVALLITSPFEDLLEIGDQTRPELFALNIVKPKSLAQQVFGVRERLNADGTVCQPMDQDQCRQVLKQAAQAGCNSLAISCLHSYCNPSHELKLAQLAVDEFQFQHVSVSHQLASVVEFVARTQTTVVDAYLGPIIRDYFETLCEQFGGHDRVQLLVMTSAGGLVDWRDYSGKDCILSGPAGGAVALDRIQRTVERPVIGLDMGGTSTDVCRVGHKIELQYESNKAGVRVLTPTLPIETVAAGGGSVCWFDGVGLRVGPHSAGAIPGPACYGRQGPLTITDLNVVSGRIPVSQFPFPVDIAASWRCIDELRDEISGVLGELTREQLVQGLRRLANQQMAEAVRSVSIKQGVDPRDHALVGFGGAAGQHISEIAEILGITCVLDHPDAGLLSAVGMGLAERQLHDVIPVYQLLQHVDYSLLMQRHDFVCTQLQQVLVSHQEMFCDYPQVDASLELRYQGTDATLSVPLNDELANLVRCSDNCRRMSLALAQQFAQLHQARFGYQRAERAIELVSLRVIVQSKEARTMPMAQESVSRRQLCELTRKDEDTVESESNLVDSRSEPESQSLTISDYYRQILRAELQVSNPIIGPAIVLNAGSTLVVEQGWSATCDNYGMLHMVRTTSDRKAGKPVAAQSSELTRRDGQFDPVLRDCYAQRLTAIATQMGHVLQQTACSVNIKQRRDYSCAIFDRHGRMLANAPHVPVHLGAMGITVRAIMQRFPVIQPGDLFLCNDPYCGGSHLPDLTVVEPVFADVHSAQLGQGTAQTTGLGQVPEANLRPHFFVANRAHHADIGGIAPGSMSVAAHCLEQEGVVISPFRLVDSGRGNWDLLAKLVGESAFPPRNWLENQADLMAQQAACERGRSLLIEYAQTLGWPTMQAYSEHLLSASQARLERFIESTLPKLTRLGSAPSLNFADVLEDGTPICVSVSRPTTTRLRIDFAGTGPASSTNLNANPSIVTAAVLYVMRCLIDDELPLNEGILQAIELLIPEGVLNPQPKLPVGLSPAVAAGNVETSQRVVDALLGALGVAAASQGTMNNLLFGNSTFGFYETICGGSGATAQSAGASAVHTHMTNTRLTDPEVLELRYPVRLLRFHVRRGSGGQGAHCGGDGVVRSFEFLQPVTVSLLSSRRSNAPFGLAGASAGSPGENWLQKPGQKAELVAANCQMEVASGTILTIYTPGGGGFGQVDNCSLKTQITDGDFS